MTGHARNCSGSFWSAPLAIHSRMVCSAVLASRASNTPIIEIGMTTRARTKRVRQEADTISRPRANDVSRTWSGYVRWARRAAQRTGKRNGRNIRAI